MFQFVLLFSKNKNIWFSFVGTRLFPSQVFYNSGKQNTEMPHLLPPTQDDAARSTPATGPADTARRAEAGGLTRRDPHSGLDASQPSILDSNGTKIFDVLIILKVS